MQVGVSQLVYKGDTESFLRYAAKTGYEVVELALKQDGDLTLKTSDADLKRIAGIAKEVGIGLVSMTHSQCTGNLLADGQTQQASIDQTRAGLEIAKKLGIGCTLHTLGRLNADLYYDDAYRNAQNALKTLAKGAKSLGVTIAAEFVWNGFLFSPLEMKRFLDEIASDRIGFYFDPGNMAVFQFPHHWVRIVGKHIKMVHLKDWKGGPLNGGWPPLLEGAVDYAAMNRELRAIGYDGPMISEVGENDAPFADTAAAIRKIIKM